MLRCLTMHTVQTADYIMQGNKYTNTKTQKKGEKQHGEQVLRPFNPGLVLGLTDLNSELLIIIIIAIGKMLS